MAFTKEQIADENHDFWRQCQGAAKPIITLIMLTCPKTDATAVALILLGVTTALELGTDRDGIRALVEALLKEVDRVSAEVGRESKESVE